MNEKVICVDCDGVLLDWEYAFDQWMKRHGYEPVMENEYNVVTRYGLEKKEGKRLIRMFNESAWIRKLPPLRDAIKYVRKLHEEHGYVFHVISSLSEDQYAQHLRTKNLREMFGNTVFEKYVYLDTGADKDHELNVYANTGCYWVEDKPENAETGQRLGLQSVLMEHGHNKNSVMSNHYGLITRVSNWKEFYDIVVGY